MPNHIQIVLAFNKVGQIIDLQVDVGYKNESMYIVFFKSVFLHSFTIDMRLQKWLLLDMTINLHK